MYRNVTERRFEVAFHQHSTFSRLGYQLDCIVESFIDKCTIFFEDAVVYRGAPRGRKIEYNSPAGLNAVCLLGVEADWGAEVIRRKFRDLDNSTLLNLRLN